MAIGPVVTMGYGAFASVFDLPRMGYKSAEIIVVSSSVADLSVLSSARYGVTIVEVSRYNIALSIEPDN